MNITSIPSLRQNYMTAKVYCQSNKCLNPWLIYGSYPDIINHTDEAKELLMNIANSYLYKDLLAMNEIRRPIHAGKVTYRPCPASKQ